MRSLRRVLTPGVMLIALFAVCVTAPSAKADLWVDISSTGGTGASSTPFDLSTAAQGKTEFASGTTTGTLSNGLQYTLTASATGSASSETLNLTGTLTGNTKGFITVNLFTTDNSTTTTVGGQFNAIKGPQLTLSATGAITVGNGGIQNVAGYTGYDASNHVTESPTATVGDPTVFNDDAKTFNLSSLALVIATQGSSPLAFNATANVVSMPEPSGIFAAMAGMPCLGLLLGWARMRRRLTETAVA